MFESKQVIKMKFVQQAKRIHICHSDKTLKKDKRIQSDLLTNNVTSINIGPSGVDKTSVTLNLYFNPQQTKVWKRTKNVNFWKQPYEICQRRVNLDYCIWWYSVCTTNQSEKLFLYVDVKQVMFSVYATWYNPKTSSTR